MILDLIELTMEQYGMAATTFALAVGKDPRLVFDMRTGRQISPAVEARIFAYIDGLNAGTVAPPPGRGRRPGLARVPRVSDTANQPAVRCNAEANARRAAKVANEAFLKALARVKPVGDARVAPEPRFARLPPPTLSGQAFS